MQDIEWIKRGLKQNGKTRTGLAAALGVSPSAITNLLSGMRQLKAREIKMAADYLEVEFPAELFAGTRKVEHAGGVQDRLRIFTRPPSISVVTVLGGRPIGGALYSAASDEEIGTLKCPAGLTGMTGVYAIFMIGSSMEPRFMDGRPIYVSATRAPAIADDVVLETTKFAGDAQGLRYVRKLIEITETEWVLKMHNPVREDRIKAATVKFVHRIFPQEELL